MLSHGLGVSSRIFTIDTIDTNLAEYLVAAGYDVWALDYRASVVSFDFAALDFTSPRRNRLAYRVSQITDKWIDLKLLREQYKKGRPNNAFKEPWFSEWDSKAIAIVHNIIRGTSAVPKGLKELTALYKSLV